MTNPKWKRSQLAKDRSCRQWVRQSRARGSLHQEIDLNTTSLAPFSVSFPFVSPPNFEHQHKSPQQLALPSQSHCNMTLQECKSYLNVCTLPPCSLFQNDHIKICQRPFLSKIYYEKRKTDPKPMFHCPFCKQRFINTQAFFRQTSWSHPAPLWTSKRGLQRAHLCYLRNFLIKQSLSLWIQGFPCQQSLPGWVSSSWIKISQTSISQATKKDKKSYSRVTSKVVLITVWKPTPTPWL